MANIFLVCIVTVIINIIIGMKFQEIAVMKGHEENYFWYCFFLGIIGALMVIALPDKNLYGLIKNSQEKETSNLTTEKNDDVSSRKKNEGNIQSSVKREHNENTTTASTTSPRQLNMRIDQTKCDGCHKCIEVCPNNAIDGNMNETHRVNNECLACGLCIDACDKGAIGY